MAISVVDPISPSVERTKQILFRPIQAGKWFVLGFCAWLAEVGNGGGSGLNFRGGGGGGGGGGAAPVPVPAPAPGHGQGAPPAALPPGMRPAIDWVQANLPLVIAIGTVVVVLVVVILLLLCWIHSRFSFVFLDNVVRDRAEIAEPWREFRRQGDSLFGFSVILSLVSLLAFAIIIGGSALLALPDIRAQQFDGAAILALAVGIPTFLAALLVLSVVSVFLHDFVVPIM